MENKFDEIIKKAALENQEEYRPEYWDAFEKKLNAQKKPNNNWMKYAVGASVVVATVATIYYFTNSYELNVPVVENNTNTTENVSENKESEKNTAESVNSISNRLIENKEENQNRPIVLITENEGVKQSLPTENKIQTTSEEKINSLPKNEIIINNTPEQSLPKITIDLNKFMVCEGEQIQLNALNVPENATISWDFGDGKSSNKKQTTYAYSKSGTYVIELACFVDKKLIQKESAQILVASNPKADFEWTDKNELEENYTISFTDQSYDAVKWEWNFGDNNFISITNPIHTYKGQGTYAVSLTVTNLNGCKDQKTQFISVLDQNPLLAPNSFSPNGDGLNDYFMPKVLENGNLNFELKILDRSGNIVYTTNDSNKPWNGRMHNTGELFNNGTPFIWIVTITTPEGKIKRFSGTVNIVN